MRISYIQANVLHIVPAEGKYLIRQGNERNPTGMHAVTEIYGPKYLITRAESVDYLRNDPAIWSRVLNKGEIPNFPFEQFVVQLDVFLKGFEETLTRISKLPNIRNGLVIITSDAPNLILDLLASLGEKKRWWQFWK